MCQLADAPSDYPILQPDNKMKSPPPTGALVIESGGVREHGANPLETKVGGSSSVTRRGLC